MTLLSLTNRAMKYKLMKKSVPLPEFKPFLRAFHALCYYSCSIQDVEFHPGVFPLVTKEVKRLKSITFHQQVDCLRDCLLSLEGSDMKDVSIDNRLLDLLVLVSVVCIHTFPPLLTTPIMESCLLILLCLP